MKPSFEDYVKSQTYSSYKYLSARDWAHLETLHRDGHPMEAIIMVADRWNSDLAMAELEERYNG